VKHSTHKIFKDYAITITVAMALAFLIRSFVIEAYRVPSLAMTPTLLPGDTLFVWKWPIAVSRNYQPKYGDVIVFSMPWGQDGSQLDFIKRVVGLPGDQIQIKKGLVHLNGQTLSTPSSAPSTQSSAECLTETPPHSSPYQVCMGSPAFEMSEPEQIPDHFVFVIGDYRGDYHSDYRGDPHPSLNDKKGHHDWGSIPISTIEGQALWIWLSIDHSARESIFFLPFSLPHLRWNRMFHAIL
jgi:signal peptidase I